MTSNAKLAHLVDTVNKQCRGLIESWSPDTRKVILTRDGAYLNSINEADRPLVEELRYRLAIAVSSYLHLESVILDTYKCLKMSRRYPWHGTSITKADHFNFVWFNFTNQCYLYSTRTKNFYNRLQEISVPFGVEIVRTNKKIKEVKTVFLRDFHPVFLHKI